MFTDTRRVAKKPSRRALAARDREIERCYYRHCAGTSINMMDIHKIFDAGRAALDAKQDLDAAIVAAIATYNTRNV